MVLRIKYSLKNEQENVRTPYVINVEVINSLKYVKNIYLYNIGLNSFIIFVILAGASNG